MFVLLFHVTEFVFKSKFLTHLCSVKIFREMSRIKLQKM